MLLLSWLVLGAIAAAGARAYQADAQPVGSDGAQRARGPSLEIITALNAQIAPYLLSPSHPLTDIPGPPEEIDFGYQLLSGSDEPLRDGCLDANPLPRLQAGQLTEVVIGLAREASASGVATAESDACRVIGSMGALYAEDDYTAPLQNFSFALVNRTLAPGQELSFTYTLAPHVAFPLGRATLQLITFTERDYTHAQLLHKAGIAESVVHQSMAEQGEEAARAFLAQPLRLTYGLAVLNGTVEIVASATGTNSRMLFTVLAGIAALVALALGIVGAVAGGSAWAKPHRWAEAVKRRLGGRAVPPPAHRPTTAVRHTPAAKDEWLEEHRRILKSARAVGSKTESTPRSGGK